MKKRGAGIVWSLVFEVVPATVFGAATGFCSATFLSSPLLSASPLAAGGAAFGGTWLMLRSLGSSRRRLYLPEFEVGGFEADAAPPEAEPEELILEEVLDELVLEDELQPAMHEDELVLENPLPQVEEDSRVIRLFDPAKMQTAGELHARIERHLQGASRPSMPDATQELHEALAALRQSLR